MLLGTFAGVCEPEEGFGRVECVFLPRPEEGCEPELAWLRCCLTVGVTGAGRLRWGVLCAWPVEPPALEELGGCPVELPPPDGADALGEEVVVLVDSLAEDEEDEEYVVEEVDVVDVSDGPGAGGLIVGAAPPEAGELSVTAVSPPPVSAESAIRRSQRRGAPVPSFADPSVINS